MLDSWQRSRSRMDGFGVKQDVRSHFPLPVSRFLGYRPPGTKLPYAPSTPLACLSRLPLKLEVWTFTWIGAFIGILLVESILSTNTVFRQVYHSPTILTSFGASAVLVFGVIESPLAQPRNFVLGNLSSAIIGVAVTKLFRLNASYMEHLESGNVTFHPTVWINGGLCTAISVTVMQVLGIVHPPAGAAALAAAVDVHIASIGWYYLPTILCSSLIMLGWALIINNLGRRRYPVYWLSPTFALVAPPPKGDEEDQKNSEQERPQSSPAPATSKDRLVQQSRGQNSSDRGRPRQGPVINVQDEEMLDRSRSMDNVLRRAEDGGPAPEMFQEERIVVGRPAK